MLTVGDKFPTFKLQAVISREKGKATIESLFEGVVDAAKASAGAAYDAARARD